jgi:hypothetical protein
MTHTHFLPRLAALSVAGVLLAVAGCSSHEPDSAATGAAPPPHVTAAAAAEQRLDMCALMPAADVAAILQAHGAGTAGTQHKSFTMCSYYDRDTGTKLLIDFTRHKSADEAKAALANVRQMFDERGIAVIQVPGLGDEAFVAETEGTEGLKICVGAYTGQINLSLGERPPASLRPAVLALAQQVLARLP